MRFICEGLAGKRFCNAYGKDACFGCVIETNGSARPVRCIYSHGPAIVDWHELLRTMPIPKIGELKK